MKYGLRLVAKPEMPESIRLCGVSVSDIFTSIEHCSESDYNLSVSFKNLTKSKLNNAILRVYCHSEAKPKNLLPNDVLSVPAFRAVAQRLRRFFTFVQDDAFCSACRSSVLPQEDGLFVIGSTFSAANGDIEEK